MEIFIIRHAHAVDAAEDPARPLSKRGRQQVRRIARFFKKTESLPLTDVWHSPLARSKETAELLVKRLGAKAKLTQVDGIDGNDDPAIVAGRLKTRRTPVAIVGHEPHLSALLSLLVAGTAEPPKFVLKKSAVVALDRANGVWAVRWHVSPELIP
ncbi:MAG TPA: phosphohistidine phosphatase SixA [Opitutus sp.]|nr:phosphohistidine phosphatase SixA [Opitutus sp.]